MSTVRMPGYTAEAALNARRRTYRASTHFADVPHPGGVAPAVILRPEEDVIDCNDFPNNQTCKECGNSGPGSVVCCPTGKCVIRPKPRLVAGWGWGLPGMGVTAYRYG